MKALTLTQPWATLVAIGMKTIETRSWGTSYRGKLAIHAAKSFPPDARSVLEYPHFKCVRWAKFPFGAIVAECELIDCVKMPDVPNYEEWIAQTFGIEIAHRELGFGNFDLFRYAWLLSNVRPISPPIPAKGMLGLWEWPVNPEALARWQS